MSESTLPEIRTQPTDLRSRIAAARQSVAARTSSIPRRPADAPAAVSPAQARLWFLWRLQPSSAACNLPIALRLHGTINRDALCEAVCDVARRHEVLRTSIRETADGTLETVANPAEAVEIVARDLRPEELADVLAVETERPFDLDTCPPMRAALLSVGASKHILLMTFHHIAMDARSEPALLADLAACYAARIRGEDLAAEPLQYADVVDWTARRATDSEQDVQWWCEQLADLPPLLDVPTDRPRPAVAGDAGGEIAVCFTPALAERVREVAAEQGVTPFMILLAAWQTLLGRLADVDEVAVGVPEAGRPHPDMAGVIGCFLGTLVMRTDLSGRPTGRELLSRVRDTVLESFIHAGAPFEQVVERLAPERSLGHTPVFQTMLNVYDAGEGLQLPGVEVTALRTAAGAAKFDLNLALAQGPAGFAGELTYRADLFDQGTAQRYADWFVRIVDGLVTDLDAPVGDEVFAASDGPAFAGPESDFVPDRPLHALIEDWAERTPDAVAVVGPDATLTYGRLDERANRIAHALLAAGVGRDQPVGILLDQGAGLATALLGVMKSGACYLPFDTTYPMNRIITMLGVAKSTVLLTDSTFADRYADSGLTVLRIDDEAALAELPATRPAVDTNPDDLLHVIFTSGSTGLPKGVATMHRNVVHYLHWMLRRLDATGGRSFAVVSTPAADFGLTCTYGALTTGGSVHLIDRETATEPEALAAYLAEHHVDVLKCVPSHLELLATHGDLERVLPHHLLVLGGEACTWDLVRRVREARADLRVQSHYGHTESTMISLTFEVGEVPAQAAGIVPLGDPLPGVLGHLVDRAGRPRPAGLPGELLITGPGISRGYLNNPELTDARFRRGPEPDERPGYLTGDLLRVGADGQVRFLGRADDQVKIRGYRVELGEVYSALLDRPEVAEAVVLPRGEGHQRILAAWLVAAAGREIDISLLRQALRERLPDYAVPAALVVLDRLPLNPNGKIDRAALPEPCRVGAAEHVAPRTPAELLIAEVWAQVLARPQLGAQDDFFAVGGHSFAAARVASRLRAALGVPVPVRLLFERPVLNEFAAQVELLAPEGAISQTIDGAAPAIARRADPAQPVPLPPAMARLWFLSQFDEDSTAYNMDMAMRLEGPLDTTALVGAVHDLVERHEALRSLFRDVDGRPMMFVQPADCVPVLIEDLTEGEDGDSGAAMVRATARLAEEQYHRFSLATEAPLRAALLRLGENVHILSVTMHHIAADNWSRGLVAEDLAALYSARLGAGPAPAALPVRFGDFAAWLHDNADEATAEADLGWWCEHLAGLPPVLEVPTDRPRPLRPAAAGAEVPLSIPADLAARVRDCAARIGATPFMVFLAAWQSLLSRLTGTDDIAVGVPEAGRHHPESERMVGCFIGTLVMRTSLAGEPSVRDLLDRVRGGVLDAFAHTETPFEKIVERLAPERSTSTTPIFQSMLNLLESPANDPTFAGLAVSPLDPPAKTAKVDLELGFVRNGEGYDGKLGYRTDLYDPSTAERMAGWYVTMLEAMVGDLDAQIGRIELEPVRPAILGAPAGSAGEGLVHELIEDWAARIPDAVAVVGPAGALTYRQLDERANQLAHALIEAGVVPNQPVGVVLEQSTDLVCALLGILKAGGGYLPFDTAFPMSRTSTMLSVAGARVVLTNSMFAGQYAEAGSLALDLGDPAVLAGRPTSRPEAATTRDDLSHIIFTSGSTGLPKGVAATHRNVLYRLHGLQGLLEDASGGSFAVVSTPAADFGLSCVFGALTTGGSVHMVSREASTDPAALAEYMAEHRIDVLKCVPSHLELLATHGDLASVLPHKFLIVAGEACPWGLVEKVRQVRPDLRMQSHYGSTETTMFSFACDVDTVPERYRGGIVPLGRPLPGVVGYLVDRAGVPVPTGMPGELVVTGPGVTRGYVNNDALTAERFAEGPAGPGKRCYRSGDLLRVRADGMAEFLGRVDDQVKIRGHRVEIGEVVTALLAFEQIAEAVVLPVGEGQARRLAAWIVPAPSLDAASFDTGAVRSALRETLPAHMVPSALVVLERLPLNPNGKIDRAKLPAPTEDRAQDRTPPTTPNELLIAGVWAQVLNVAEVAADDDFFAIGGHSFAAVSAVRKIGNGLRIIDLFMHPTVASLARLLDERSAGQAQEAGLLHRLSPPTAAAAETTLVCVPYGGGSAAVYQPVAQALGERMNVLAVELPGHDPARPDELPMATDALVDLLAAEIRAKVPGPVALYGHCVGSALATALATRLEAEGGQVSGVFVAGSFPTARLSNRFLRWAEKRFPQERWVSDRLFRDTLRATGGLPDEIDATTADTVVRAMRHDARQAQAWFGRQLTEAPAARLHAPMLSITGERDLSAEMYQERYREWGAFAERVELATLPRAGHYFLRHQAEGVADLIVSTLARWRQEAPPPPTVDLPPVTGTEARRNLRAFFTVAIGQLVSMIGSALSAFALGVWTYQRTGQIGDLALVLLLTQLPMILLTPIGGAIADRIDRRLIMLICDAASGLGMAALVVLLLTHQLDLGWVLGIVTVTSTAAAFQTPAYLAAIAQLVPKPYLTQANGFAEIGLGVGTVFGPLLGGLLMSLAGLSAVVAVDVATFGVGVATLLAVRFPDLMFVKQEEPFRKALAGGWRFIVRRRPMIWMVGYFAVVNFFTAVMWVGVTPLVLSIGSVGSLGFVEAAGGVGAVAGSIAAIAWGGTRRRATGMIAFVIGSGAGVALMGVGPTVALVAVGLFIRLACMSLGNAHWLSIIQTKVGHELQGRVLAVNLMLAAVMQPLGFLSTGPLAAHVFGPLVAAYGPWAGTVGRITGSGPHSGIALMMLLSGLFLAGWGVLGLRMRPLRHIEDLLPDIMPGAEIADRDTVQAQLDNAITG